MGRHGLYGAIASVLAPAGLALAASAAPQPRFADKNLNAIPVDVELVIAVDVSYSMDPEEQALQREGYVMALTSREFMRALREGAIPTAHDIAEGGLAVALAECCIASGLGARVDVTGLGADAEALLFGEGPGGVVLAGPRDALERLPGATVIGEVAGDQLEFASPAGSLRIEVERAREVYERAIPDLMS